MDSARGSSSGSSQSANSDASPRSIRAGFEDDDAELAQMERMRRDTCAACMLEVEIHLDKFLRSRGDGTYEQWIGELHPENVRTDVRRPGEKTLDHRFYIEGSDHRRLWNSRVYPMRRIAPRKTQLEAPVTISEGPLAPEYTTHPDHRGSLPARTTPVFKTFTFSPVPVAKPRRYVYEAAGSPIYPKSIQLPPTTLPQQVRASQIGGFPLAAGTVSFAPAPPPFQSVPTPARATVFSSSRRSLEGCWTAPERGSWLPSQFASHSVKLGGMYCPAPPLNLNRPPMPFLIAAPTNACAIMN